MKYTFLFILVFTRISFCQQLNCSAFITQGNKILLAKNLDFELCEGLVLFNPAGIEKNSLSNYGTSWNSKFASITFNMFGLNLPLGGINSEGLAIEELSTYPVQYKDSGESKLNEFELIQYILDNYATVNEIERNLDKISVDRFYFTIHYIICDSFGNNAVLEYHNGSAKYITGNEFKYKVLTNNNYTELLKYKNLYVPSPHRKLDHNTSQDRFLKIINELNEQFTTEKYNTIGGMMDILDSVRVEDTQWSIVYELKEKEMHYKTLVNNQIRNIRFNTFANKKGYYFSSIDDGINFREFNREINKIYLESLMQKVLTSGSDPQSELVLKLKKLKDKS